MSVIARRGFRARTLRARTRDVCFRGLALWKYRSAPLRTRKSGIITLDVAVNVWQLTSSQRVKRETIPQILPRIRPRCSIHSARHVGFIAPLRLIDNEIRRSFIATRQWLAIIAFARVYVEAKRSRCSQIYRDPRSRADGGGGDAESRGLFRSNVSRTDALSTCRSHLILPIHPRSPRRTQRPRAVGEMSGRGGVKSIALEAIYPESLEGEKRSKVRVRADERKLSVLARDQAGATRSESARG